MTHSPETTPRNEWPGTDPAELLNDDELFLVDRFLEMAGQKNAQGDDFVHAKRFKLAHMHSDQGYTEGYQGRGYPIGRVRGTENDFGNEVAVLCEDGRIRVTRERALNELPKKSEPEHRRHSAVPLLGRNIVGRGWIGSRLVRGIVAGGEDYDTIPDGARLIPGIFSRKTNGSSFTPLYLGDVLANHLGANDGEKLAAYTKLIEDLPRTTLHTAANPESAEKKKTAEKLAHAVDATWESAVRYTKGESRGGDDKDVPFERMSPESLAYKVVIPQLALDIQAAKKHGLSARDFSQLAPKAKESIIGNEAIDAALPIAQVLHEKLQDHGLVSKVYQKGLGYEVTGTPQKFESVIEQIELGKLRKQHELALHYLAGDYDVEIGSDTHEQRGFASIDELEMVLARRSGLYITYFENMTSRLPTQARTREERHALQRKLSESREQAMERARKDVRKVASQHFNVLETAGYVERDRESNAVRLILIGENTLRQEIAELQAGDNTDAVRQLLHAIKEEKKSKEDDQSSSD